jgi:hypothetical protein
MSSELLEKYLQSKQFQSKHNSFYTKTPRQDSNPSSPSKNSISRLRLTRKFSPVYWNAENLETKKIRLRGRNDDFYNDSIKHLFSNKTPTSRQEKSFWLPDILNRDKSFFKKTDKLIQHKKEMVRMRKQGFFEPKTRLDLR